MAKGKKGKQDKQQKGGDNSAVYKVIEIVGTSSQSWADAGSYHRPFYGILETGWNEPAHRWSGSYAPHVRSWCLHGDDICNAIGLRAATCAVSCPRETGYISSGYTRDAAFWAYRTWTKLS